MPPRRRSGRTRRPVPILTPRVLPRADRFEVWLFDCKTPLRRVTSVRRALVDDARHHGQDLLDEAVCSLLRKLEASRVT